MPVRLLNKYAVRLVRLALLGWAAWSGVAFVDAEPAAATEVMDATLDTRPGVDLEWHQGWDKSSAASLNGASSGSLAVSTQTAIAAGQLGFGRELSLGAGFQYSHVGLSANSALPLPTHLQSEGLGLGAIWRPLPELGGLLQVLPAFSSDSGRLSSKSFNVTGVAEACWQRGDFLWEGGVQFDSLGRYPLFPCGGVVYGISRELSLQLLFPQSRIAYDLGGGLSVYVGANFEYQSFRAGSSFGNGVGRPKLDNAALTFEETSWGPGVTYRIRKAVSLDLMLGEVASRSFEFFRAGITVEPKSAACARASIVALF